MPVSSSLHSFPTTAPIESIMSLRISRKRSKTTLFALLALVSVSCYVFYFSRHDMSFVTSKLPGRTDLSNARSSATRRVTAAREAFAFRKSKMSIWAHGSHHTTQGPPLELEPAHELAAVSSFLASLPQNVIPAGIDPSLPIDPQLVLDFDTRSLKAPAEVQAMMEEVWSSNPVVLYSKHFSPQSRELKNLLSTMKLTPPVTIFDVDLRPDSEVLEPLIRRLLTSSPYALGPAAIKDLPLLLIGGKPIGSVAHIKALHKSGALKRMVVQAGAIVGTGKHKNGRRGA